VRDIDTAEVDSLKVLDPNPPIREADIEAIEATGCPGSSCQQGVGKLVIKEILDNQSISIRPPLIIQVYFGLGMYWACLPVYG
jgi:hypothetical protein